MIKIVSLANAGTVAPTQWFGTTDKGESVYIRYRWGRLRVCWDPSLKTIFEKVLTTEPDGYMEYDQLKAILAGEFELPERET